MAYRQYLIGLLALAWLPSWAGFAEAVPPTGWATGSSAPTFNFQAQPGNAAVYSANGVNTVRTTTALNVGGRSVVLPAAMRFAANAPQFAARGLYLNPYLAAASLGLVGIQWWLSQSSVKWDQSQQKWVQEQSFGWPIGTGLEYKTVYSRNGDVYKPTKEAACQQMAATANVLVIGGGYAYQAVSGSTCIISRNGVPNAHSSPINQRNGGCPVGTWVNPQGQCMVSGTQNVPLTPQQFETILPGVPMPPSVPLEVPVPLPVEQPVINPNPYPTGAPAPVIIPVGSPVLQPDGVTWKQPAIRVVPSPTPSSPWRVDIQPREVNSPTNNPLPDPVRDPFNPTVPNGPLTTPSGTPTTVTNPNPSAPPSGGSQAERQPSLCEQYPDILACQKPNLGDVQPTPVPNTNKTLAINKDSGWGPENGTCPAPKTATVMGVSLSMPFTAICQFATAIRPLLIGFAYLTAALTFFGFARRGD